MLVLVTFKILNPVFWADTACKMLFEICGIRQTSNIHIPASSLGFSNPPSIPGFPNLGLSVREPPLREGRPRRRDEQRDSPLRRRGGNPRLFVLPFSDVVKESFLLDWHELTFDAR